MKKLFFLLICSLFVFAAQAQTTKEMQETAKGFMRQGDYDNAILVLNRASEQDPQNLDLLKDLTYAYYLQRNTAKAAEVVNKFQDRDDLDVQSYQIISMIYLANSQNKEAEKNYKRALKRFPAIGVLYYEYGGMLAREDGAAAVKLFQKGIEVDPNYAGNYYYMAMHHFNNGEKFWSLIYGEIFVNMESLSARTIEMKNVLLEGYKKLFQDSNLWENYTGKKDNPFAQQVLQTLNNQNGLAAGGINIETLMAIRTRFVLDWYNAKSRPAFRLFEQHRQMLQDGLFEAYNQWLFGPAANAAQYQNWVSTHPEEQKEFSNFQRSRLFKIPAGQQYFKN
jgi:tetratricopeptide (TPR) repeat protein